jgi:hypothetical protein
MRRGGSGGWMLRGCAPSWLGPYETGGGRGGLGPIGWHPMQAPARVCVRRG